MNEINNERKMMMRLEHENLISMKAAWAENGYLYLVYNLAINGDLSQFLKEN